MCQYFRESDTPATDQVISIARESIVVGDSGQLALTSNVESRTVVAAGFGLPRTEFDVAFCQCLMNAAIEVGSESTAFIGMPVRRAGEIVDADAVVIGKNTEIVQAINLVSATDDSSFARFESEFNTVAFPISPGASGVCVAMDGRWVAHAEDGELTVIGGSRSFIDRFMRCMPPITHGIAELIANECSLDEVEAALNGPDRGGTGLLLQTLEQNMSRADFEEILRRSVEALRHES